MPSKEITLPSWALIKNGNKIGYWLSSCYPGTYRISQEFDRSQYQVARFFRTNRIRAYFCFALLPDTIRALYSKANITRHLECCVYLLQVWLWNTSSLANPSWQEDSLEKIWFGLMSRECHGTTPKIGKTGTYTSRTWDHNSYVGSQLVSNQRSNNLWCKR